MNLFERLSSKPFFIAGPCVIEDYALLETVAKELLSIKEDLGVEMIFKSSFDKANRTSISSFRGPGLVEGLKMLNQIKEDFDLPITTDIHEPNQAAPVGEVVDIVQIPAFLCRQTDLLVEAGKTNRIVNIKKAQFLSAQDMKYPVDKVKSTGNDQVMLTERGTIMGYNNLVVDFRNIPWMKAHGVPVVMDCTHSVQRPGAGDGKTVGDRDLAPYMAYASKEFGANGYFMEVHPDPDNGKSDAANMLYLKDLRSVIKKLIS